MCNVLALFLFVALCFTCEAAFTRAYTYNYTLSQSNQFRIFWSFNSPNVQIGIEAQASGWIGVGTSRGTGMFNSDVYIGYVDSSSVAHLNDYNIGNLRSVSLDSQQNCTYVYGEKSGNMLRFEFDRPIAATDSNDMALLLNTTMRVVWATSSSIPTSSTSILQHSSSGITPTGTSAFSWYPNGRAPGPVTNISSNPGIYNLTISWNPPDPVDSLLPVTAYKLYIYLLSSYVLKYTGLTTAFTITGLSAETSYSIKIEASNAKGVGNSTVVTFATLADPDVPGQPPSAPGNPAIVSHTDNMLVSWSSPLSGPVVNYTLQKDDGTESDSEFVTIYEGNQQNYQVNGLSMGAYRYRVRATNNYGVGNWSEIAIATTCMHDQLNCKLTYSAGYYAKGILPGEYSNSVSLLNGNYQLHWKSELVDSTYELDIGIEVNGTGFVGFGLGNTMPGADIIAGAVDDDTGTVTVNDYFGTIYGEPTLDTSDGGQDNILKYNGKQENGITTIKFKRKFLSTDAHDISVTRGMNYIIVSFHPDSDTLSYHSNNRGISQVTFLHTNCTDSCNFPNGICVNGICNCTAQFDGAACSQDSLCVTRADCSNNGDCINRACICDEGFLPPLCAEASGIGNAEIQPNYYQYESEVMGGKMRLYWKLVDSTTVEVAVVSIGLGWVGFGLGTDMINADIYIGKVENGIASVKDYWSTSFNTPIEDTSRGGTNDILDYTGVENSEGTTIKFRRKLDTRDTRDKVITNGKLQCIMAYNPDGDSLALSHGSHAVSLEIDFFVGSVEEHDKTKLRAAHGGILHLVTLQSTYQRTVLMALSWGFLVIVGIFIAKFTKHSLGPLWFKIHTLLNIVSIFCTVAAFVISVVMVNDDFAQRANLNLAHAWLGLIVMIGAPLQGFLGFIADRMYDEDRDVVPIWPDKIHWWVGRLVTIIALINVLLGMLALQISTVWIIIYLVWVGVAFLVYCVIMMQGKKYQFM